MSTDMEQNGSSGKDKGPVLSLTQFSFILLLFVFPFCVVHNI